MEVAEQLAEHLRPPRQGRSRATQERVMAAFVRLLEAKPFDQITMAELAAEAPASLPSIYARFGDKKALLLAAHEDFKASVERELDRLAAEGRRPGRSAEEVLVEGADRLCTIFEENHNLLRGVVLADSPILYRRASALTLQAADRLVGVVRREVPDADAAVIDAAAQRALSTAVALLQQWLIFGDGPGSMAQPLERLREHVTELFVAVLEQARRCSGASPAMTVGR
jgi:AcrR family transcriptional regulator